MKLCELAKNGIKIYICIIRKCLWNKKKKKVHENLDLVPISDYNKTKMIAEKVIETYKNFNYYLIRPGTAFGYSQE